MTIRSRPASAEYRANFDRAMGYRTLEERKAEQMFIEKLREGPAHEWHWKTGLYCRHHARDEDCPQCGPAPRLAAAPPRE